MPNDVPECWHVILIYEGVTNCSCYQCGQKFHRASIKDKWEKVAK